jgi:hypothetical protein
MYFVVLWLAGHVEAKPAGLFSKNLPAWFARLTRVALIVIAPTAPSSPKALSAASWPIRLGLGLIDGQWPSPQICSVQSCDRLIGLTGVGHFYKRETSRASRIPVRHQADLFHRTVRLKNVSQFSLGCAVG